MATISESPFHAGEQFVQIRAESREDSEELGRQIIRNFMPEQHRLFFTSQGALPLIFLSSVDDLGRPWSSVIIGKDFVTSPDNQTLKFQTRAIEGDPLQKNLKNGAYIGLVGIEFATRRRNRMNGRVELIDGGFLIHVDQSFGNCPKYIQARTWKWNNTRFSSFQNGTSATPVRSSTLSNEYQQFIRNSDTFFVATAFLDTKDTTSGIRPSAYGCDVSHRGGRPGFVQVLDEKTLKWPDYLGNFMFNTLGNIQKYPKSGLLFMDFSNGDLLQLTGSATVLYDDTSMPGSQRMVQYMVDEVLYFKQIVPLDWKFIDASPFNPEVSLEGSVKNQFGLESLILKCKEVIQESHNVKTYKFWSGVVMAHQPGQYATIELEVNGKTYTRTWTISSFPESPNWNIAITVKKKHGGVISNWLFNNMAPGMTVKLLGISGEFTLSKAKDSKVLMIAGGVGVTPMLSMIRHITHKKLSQDVVLLWSVSSSQDLLPTLEASKFPPNIKIVPTVSQPSKEWNGLNSRIGIDMIQNQVPDLHQRKIFLCGPELFMQSVESSLVQLGFPSQNVFTEKFDF